MIQRFPNHNREDEQVWSLTTSFLGSAITDFLASKNMYTTETKCRGKYKEYCAAKKRGNQRKRICYLRYACVPIHSVTQWMSVMQESQSALEVIQKYKITLELERLCPKPRDTTPTHHITLLDPSSSTLCPQFVFSVFCRTAVESNTPLLL